MGQTDSVQTETVAIVEPTPSKEAEIVLELHHGQELDEVVIIGGEQAAPLAQEEENLSICEEDFATPEAVSPTNLQETLDMFTSIKPPVGGASPTSIKPVVGASPITPVADNINGIQRCESPVVETSDKTF